MGDEGSRTIELSPDDIRLTVHALEAYLATLNDEVNGAVGEPMKQGVLTLRALHGAQLRDRFRKAGKTK